ncbi:MAG: translation elongation factor Ts [bacterium]
MIDAKLVAELRETTGAGMMDVKRALEEAEGDQTKAIEILRKKGLSKAAKKSEERTAAEGLLFTYIHANGKIGVILELNCETDFVARNQDFQDLGKELSMQVAAADPLYVRREDVPAEMIEKEKEMARAELAEQKKPAEIIEKIVVGKMDKYFGEICLMEQVYIKDDNMKVSDLVASISAKLGEKMVVSRFTRYAIAAKVVSC